MKRARPPSEPSGARRPSWGALADAVGHCMLVFVFAPTLAALPRWLSFEAGNPLNGEDPLVLVFLPVRGMLVLASAFSEGVVPGVLAGLIDGVLVATWCTRHGVVSTRAQRLLLGGVGGALASALMTLVVLAVRASARGSFALPATAIAFEVASGAVCGILAAPGAVRLATAPGDGEAARAMASPTC